MAAVAAIFVFKSAMSLPPAMLAGDQVQDVYFESDMPRVFRCMTDRYVECSRSMFHPLFQLVIGAPTHAAAKVFGDKKMAVAAVLAANAFCMVGLLFLVIRSIVRRLLDSLLLTGVFLASAPFLFWAAIPDSFTFGATTMLAAIALMIGPREWCRPKGFVAAGVLGLGMTVTNWMAAGVASLLSFGFRRSVTIAVATLAVTLAMWTVQQTFFPLSENPLLLFVSDESHALGTAGSPLVPLRQVLLDLVYPLDIIQRPNVGLGGQLLDIAGLDAMTPVAAAVWVLWAALLACGGWRIWESRKQVPVGVAVALILMLQVALHTVYGAELNFLYSIHLMPFYVLLVAFGATGRARPFVLLTCALLVLVMGPRNYQLQQDSIARILELL